MDGRASDTELSITRLFDAPRSLVFRMWVDPKHVVRWWGPGRFTTLSCTMDVRPGGAWRVRSRSPEGVDHTEQGVYREIVEPERLVFTHAWEDAAGTRSPETLVTVTFIDEHGKTKLVFHQAPFESVAERDGHHEGWSSAFDLLDEYLPTV